MEDTAKEGLDTLREHFSAQSKKYQELIDEQISRFRENTSLAGKVVLIAGATLLAGYLIGRALFSKPKSDAYRRNTGISGEQLPVSRFSASHPLMKLFWESITVFLLSIARQKLQELLNRPHEESRPVSQG
jgi:hypothetical protein